MVVHVLKILPYLLVILGTYFSSGSLVPMNLSTNSPVTREPCPYVYNSDYVFHEAIINLVSFQSKGTWEWSVFISRPLYYFLARPFMKLFGFDLGGVLFNILLHLVTLFVFSRYCSNRFGAKTSLWALWLSATYPAIYYFSGYAQLNAIIVPSTIFMFILADQITNLHTTLSRTREILFPLIIGVLLLGYDLIVFFLPLLFLGSLKKGWKYTLKVTCFTFLPSITYYALIRAVGANFHKTHTDIFKSVILAYVTPTDQYTERLFQNIYLGILDFPPTFFFSNMIFIPALALLVALFFSRQEWEKFRLELTLLLTALGLYVFVQFSPTNPELRNQVVSGIKGVWCVRVYQPIYLSLFMFILYKLSTLEGKKALILKTLTILVMLGNLTIIFGTVLKIPIAGYAYHKFYKHGEPEIFMINRNRFGVYPIGTCKVKK